MNDFSFGGYESPKDHRDIGLANVITPVELPKSYFNNVDMLGVYHQHKVGCCGGCATAKYKEKIDLQDTGDIQHLSFRFPYAVAKCIDNFPDEGTYTRTLAKVFKDYGCATEKTCESNSLLDHETFVYKRKLENIPEEAIKSAEPYKISSYAFVDLTLEGMKQAVIQGKGFILLLRLGNEWWTNREGNSSWKAIDIYPLRAPKKPVSGHFVYVYGYEGDYFYILNSWGDTWAIEGTNKFNYWDYKDYLIEAITFVDVSNSLVEKAHNESPVFKYNFTKDLKFGDKSPDVEALQKALKVEGLFNYSCTGFYGDLTRQAVLAFQNKYKITSLWENTFYRGKLVGVKTRNKLNLLYNK